MKLSSIKLLLLVASLSSLSACSGGSSDEGTVNEGDINPAPAIPIVPATPEMPVSSINFELDVHQAVIQNSCVQCHSGTGPAQNTRLVFEKGSTVSVVKRNEQVLLDFDDHNRLLSKAIGSLGHGGGTTIAASSSQYASLFEYLSNVNQPTVPAIPVQIPDNAVISPGLVTSFGFNQVSGSMINDDQSVVTNAVLKGDLSINDGIANFGGVNNQSGSIDVPVVQISNKIDKEITLSLWSNGNNSLPQNTTILYAADINGDRLLNIHLPFGNTIYWDAGNGSSYDRISKSVSPADYKGRWVHWVFVKNAATGDMQIYMDGQLYHSGTGKTKGLSGINTLLIGAKNSDGAYGYKGQLDVLRIYNRALNASEIQTEFMQGREAKIASAPPVVPPVMQPAPEPVSPVVVPPAPVVPNNPIPTDLDTDKDGILNDLDQYPNDASKIADPGYRYERWSKRASSTEDILNKNILFMPADTTAYRAASFDLPFNFDDNYVQHVQAYFVPKQSGDYYFYVAVDDGARVWLSSNAQPTNKQQIIDINNWSNHNQFTKHAAQKSAKISLQANQPYYLEAIAFEGDGGDNLSLAYTRVENGKETSRHIIDTDELVQFYLSEGLGNSALVDTDNDGILNYADTDDDNDGVADGSDKFPLNSKESIDSDKDGLGDNADSDDDNDGVVDSEDAFPYDPARNGVDDDVLSLNKTVIQGKCMACHSSTGVAKNTELVFTPGNTISEIFYNESKLSYFITEQANGGTVLLDKSRGLNSHGGGQVLALGSAEYNLLDEFVKLFSNDPSDDMGVDGTYTIETPAQTYRRAALYLTGEIPKRSKLNSLQTADDAQLRTEILALMKGDAFHNFIKDGANDRLHSRHLANSSAGTEFLHKYYTGEKNDIRKDLAEEPLELIAYIVENDRPYSEVLTADYTMVSQYTAQAFQTGKNLAQGQWQVAKNKGQDIKSADTFNSDATGEMRVQDYPHAGVLSTWAFNSKYPTTATNRNRARASWTLKHFLGFDIEKSSSRVLDIADVADESNPTMNNPACVACHQTLDPIAGAFKYFHERVGYKAFGTDSLDDLYRADHPDVDWYQDMLPAGYRNDVAPEGEDPMQWLVTKLVEDYRFATGTVKFWWPAIFGENVLGANAPRVQYDAQEKLINRLANDFREHLNLKQLLADMMVSHQFRADKKADDSITDADMSLHMGARHLLSSHQLLNKTLSLTGLVWDENNPKLTKDYNALYGGIDSVLAEERARDMSSLMYRVAERQALNLSCSAVLYDFDKSKGSRRLFTEVERDTVTEAAIRAQIVVLYERLLNRNIESNSTETDEAYQLFLDLREVRHARGGNVRIQESNRCDWRKSGSDNDQFHVLGPWRGVLVGLMVHPDYLYE